MLFGVHNCIPQIDSGLSSRKHNIGEVNLQIPPSLYHCIFGVHLLFCRDRCGRGRVVVGFTTTCAIIAYHH
jgi:hypothetical protein